MNRREMIAIQLAHGLPESWIDDELVEALELARGGTVLKYPAVECAEPRHAVALLRLAAKVESE